MGPSPGFNEMFGYTEPFRRFVQHETFSPQANEIPNQAASWLPGDDYYTNFHEGDPFIKIDEGYARLPGKGYEALHPELKDVNPEDYPDIHKMSILADVAPYSREYHTFRQKVGSQAQGNTELEIEYEKILTRVKKTRESVIKMNDQGSPSCPTQNPSRARQAKAHSMGSMIPPCDLSVCREDRLAWFLPPAEPKTPRARRRKAHSRKRRMILLCSLTPCGERTGANPFPRWQEYEVVAGCMTGSAVSLVYSQGSGLIFSSA